MIRTVGLANFFTFVDLSHLRWCYHFFKVGLYCLNHRETQFSLSVMLRKTSSFLGFVAFMYTVSSSRNTFTLLLSTELALERIFYLEIPEQCDTACLPWLAPWGHSKGDRLAFGGCTCRPVPTLFHGVTWAELCRVDGTPSVPQASVELGPAPDSCSAEWWGDGRDVPVGIEAFILMSDFLIWGYVKIHSNLIWPSVCNRSLYFTEIRCIEHNTQVLQSLSD